MIDYKAEYQKWLHSDAITEDEQKDGEKKLQDITDKYIKSVEDMTKKKEDEILSI